MGHVCARMRAQKAYLDNRDVHSSDPLSTIWFSGQNVRILVLLMQGG